MEQKFCLQKWNLTFSHIEVFFLCKSVLLSIRTIDKIFFPFFVKYSNTSLRYCEKENEMIITSLVFVNER